MRCETERLRNRRQNHERIRPRIDEKQATDRQMKVPAPKTAFGALALRQMDLKNGPATTSCGKSFIDVQNT